MNINISICPPYFRSSEVAAKVPDLYQGKIKCSVYSKTGNDGRSHLEGARGRGRFYLYSYFAKQISFKIDKFDFDLERNSSDST